MSSHLQSCIGLLEQDALLRIHGCCLSGASPEGASVKAVDAVCQRGKAQHVALDDLRGRPSAVVNIPPLQGNGDREVNLSPHALLKTCSQPCLQATLSWNQEDKCKQHRRGKLLAKSLQTVL